MTLQVTSKGGKVFRSNDDNVPCDINGSPLDPAAPDLSKGFWSREELVQAYNEAYPEGEESEA